MGVELLFYDALKPIYDDLNAVSDDLNSVYDDLNSVYDGLTFADDDKAAFALGDKIIRS